jgi:hypothetical protein
VVLYAFLCVLCVKGFSIETKGFNTEDTEKCGKTQINLDLTNIYRYAK